jgi:hypothetical protein
MALNQVFLSLQQMNRSQNVCSAQCNPLCQFHWIKPDGTIIDGSNLEIPRLSKNDHGTFTCHTSNGYGNNATKNLTVTVNWVFNNAIWFQDYYNATKITNMTHYNITDWDAYIITTVLKTETDITTSIGASPVGRAVILVIMFVETFKAAILLFTISSIIMWVILKYVFKYQSH